MVIRPLAFAGQFRRVRSADAQKPELDRRALSNLVGRAVANSARCRGDAVSKRRSVTTRGAISSWTSEGYLTRTGRIRSPQSWATSAQHLGKSPTRGSLHSNAWRGWAVDLADKHAVAIYPVNGWWPKQPEICERQTRYALVVSIETDAEEVGVCLPVFNQIVLDR